MITRVIGITKLSIEDEIVSVPSTAESTEIAGVIMLSPKNSAAPNTPRPASTNFAAPGDLAPDLADLRDQRHDPALALVVGLHHQADVLDGDDQRHRPEDQGDEAVDALQRRLDRDEGRSGRTPSGSCRSGWCRCRRRRRRARRPRAPSCARRALRRRPCGKPMPEARRDDQLEAESRVEPCLRVRAYPSF